jgi:hypothetical protein
MTAEKARKATKATARRTNNKKLKASNEPVVLPAILAKDPDPVAVIATVNNKTAVMTPAERKATMLEDLDQVSRVWKQLAIEGADEKAANAYLKVQDTIAKLEGLYAPTESRLTGANGGPLQVDTVDLSAIPLNDLKTIYAMLQIESK